MYTYLSKIQHKTVFLWHVSYRFYPTFLNQAESQPWNMMNYKEMKKKMFGSFEFENYYICCFLNSTWSYDFFILSSEKSKRFDSKTKLQNKIENNWSRNGNMQWDVMSFHPDEIDIKWKHFPRYWPFVRGIHRSPVNSPHKGQWRGALMFSLICTWIDGCVNNHEAGNLRCHRGHYDVNVMESKRRSLTLTVM